jgi:hypothetical protein
MFNLIVKLLLDCAQLVRAQRVEAHYRSRVSTREAEGKFTTTPNHQVEDVGQGAGVAIPVSWPFAVDDMVGCEFWLGLKGFKTWHRGLCLQLT